MRIDLAQSLYLSLFHCVGLGLRNRGERLSHRITFVVETTSLVNWPEAELRYDLCLAVDRSVQVDPHE